MDRKRTQTEGRVEAGRNLSPKSPGNGDKPARECVKVTLYIRPDQVVAIEDIQLRERKRTDNRRDKSSLVQEALDLLVEKYLPRK